MTDFIQSFEPTRQTELDMIKNLEENIVDLMQKTSRLMEKSSNIPLADPTNNDWE